MRSYDFLSNDELKKAIDTRKHILQDYKNKKNLLKEETMDMQILSNELNELQKELKIRKNN